MTMTIETSTPTQGVRARSWAFWVAYVLASALIIVSYSSIFRPMWIDEAIHFVLSGQSTLGELLLRLHNPDAGFLTRQTGFYQVINYVTLQVTGANWVALRLPSIATAALMIWAMYTFLRERGVSRTFQFVGLIALAGQAGFMYYVGEARPYLPYAATTLGVLAYFTASATSQSKPHVTWLGSLSLFLGALFHLYFLLVLPLILAYSVWYRFFSTNSRPTRAALIRGLHVRLVGTSVALALILGWLTWMRPQATNQLDAFAWTGGSLTSLADTVLNFHLEFLPAPALRTSFLIIEVGLVLYLLVSRRYRRNRALFASGVLIFVALFTSVIISAASVANNYAIANRQLVVGPLLIAVAATWQLYVIAKSAGRLSIGRFDLVTSGLFGLAYGLAVLEVNRRWPLMPLSLLIVVNVLLLALWASTNSATVSPWRARGVVGLVSALGLIATSLSVTTRIAPRWQSIVAVAVGLVLIALAALWLRRYGQMPVSTVFTAAILISFLASAASIAGSRFIIIESQYTTYSALKTEALELGTDGLTQLKNLDKDALLDLQTSYGSGMEYLSNLNAITGGEVWPILGSL